MESFQEYIYGISCSTNSCPGKRPSPQHSHTSLKEHSTAAERSTLLHRRDSSWLLVVPTRHPSSMAQGSNFTQCRASNTDPHPAI